MKALIFCAVLLAAACATDDNAVRAAGSDDHFSHRVDSHAHPSAVYAVWTDVAAWPTWDVELESARLDGPFVAGARGVLIPKDGPEATFTVTAVEPGRRTVIATELPGGSLVIDRTVSVEGGRTVFVHDVRFEGTSAPLFSFLLGDRYRRALPDVMERVRARAEAAVAAPTTP